MKILTSKQMRDIDRTAIEELGIPGLVLMENAGLRVVRALRAKFPHLEGERVVVVAGKGNNGGDGFVFARHLFNAGGRPEVVLLAKADEVGGDAAVNLAVVRRMGVPVTEAADAAEWAKARPKVARATVVVDALFGTGLVKPLEGFYAAAVADINRSAAFKLSVDIPSGLSSDTFETAGPSVAADLTVTLAAPKIAHVFSPAADRVGELIVAPIGIPPALFDRPDLALELVEEERLRPFFA
ncbi:MAG: NAD(P)H-hydrate epimerase, partial [Acidobacteria bacterium]|nr:NAD(P)H-hydrate epimerase [Acidobacteriota bacterium]